MTETRIRVDVWFLNDSAAPRERGEGSRLATREEVCWERPERAPSSVMNLPPRQDDPSQEALERLASSQAKDLEILLSKVRSQAESSGLKNAMDEEERRCTSRILTLSRGEDGLTLVTSGGKCSETINEQSPQPDGPNAVTPDPKATPSVWGTFEGMFSPVKQQVKKKVKDIQQKVEDKVNLLLAAQSQERGVDRERAQGEEGQADDCKKGRIVVTADGHSYEGGLNELGAMHGYGVLRWSDGHCFQGEFRDGETAGAGQRKWASGHYYIGEEQKGMKRGLGVFSWPSGRRYEGRFENDLRSGDFGIMSWPDGGWYGGGWDKGVKHGAGLEYEGGSSCYLVVYKNGQLQRKESLQSQAPSTAAAPTMASFSSTTPGRRRGDQVASGQRKAHSSAAESGEEAKLSARSRLTWGLEVIAGNVVAVPPPGLEKEMVAIPKQKQQQQQQQQRPASGNGPLDSFSSAESSALSQGDQLMSPPAGSRSAFGDSSHGDDSQEEEFRRESLGSGSGSGAEGELRRVAGHLVPDEDEEEDEDEDEEEGGSSKSSSSSEEEGRGAVERLSTEAIMLAMLQGGVSIGKDVDNDDEDEDEDDDEEEGQRHNRLLAEKLCSEQEQVSSMNIARVGSVGTSTSASSSRPSSSSFKNWALAPGEEGEDGDAQFVRAPPSQPSRATADALLLDAAKSGNAEMLLAAIDDGADLDVVDEGESRSTALHHASREGYLDCVCLLLGARADANLKNSYLDTAMHGASTAGHTHVVEALVKGGGDVNAESEDGETSLHCAAYAGQARSCRVLVSLGADMHRASHADGDTPLHRAAFAGNEHVIETLLRCRADPARLNSDGLTALEVADLRQHAGVVSLLQPMACGEGTPEIETDVSL